MNIDHCLLEALQDFWFCPTTGRVLDGPKHDDKVICPCSPTLTHLKRSLRRATVEEYIADRAKRSK